MTMHFPQRLFEPGFALSDIRRSWITGSVGEPHGNITAVQAISDLDAIFRMLQRLRSHRSIRISKRSMLVNLVLKKVRVYGSRLDSIALGQCGHIFRARDTFRKIPQNM